MSFSDNMLRRMESQGILMMTLFHVIRFVRHMRHSLSGSTTRVGKVCHSYSRLVKVRVAVISVEKARLILPIALNEAKVEIRIQFRDVTQGIFKDIARNELVMRIQPSEALYLKLNTKTPGLYTRAMPTEMDLTYKRRFTDTKIPEAYEALILDAFKGDHSNFVRDDELDAAWKV